MATGFFDFLKTSLTIKKIVKSGKTLPLSRSQIVSVLVNLHDAETKLTEEQFAQVFELYKAYRNDTTPISMDKQAYFDTGLEIINAFNKIAPYKEYKIS